MSQFLGQSLRLARLFHGLSLQELADQVGRSKQYLNKIEAGLERPTAAIEATLAEKLLVLPEFFYFADPMPIADDQCHFRKQLTTKAALRQIARARGEMLKRLVSVLDERLTLPAYRFLVSEPASAEAIEQAAEKSRIDWGLRLGPISNMTRVAENSGAVVVKVDGLADEIDAVSFATRRPVITLNANGKSTCRARFAIAHEIGHLSLHVGVQTGDRLTESQANRFASAFLMPRTYFAGECRAAVRGIRLNWSALSEIKRKWGVSKAAILYRGRQLGVFSEAQYKTGVIHLNRHGEALRESEDSEILDEQPEIVADGLIILEKQCGLPRAAIAREMRVQSRLVSALLGVTPQRPIDNVLPLFG